MPDYETKYSRKEVNKAINMAAWYGIVCGFGSGVVVGVFITHLFFLWG